MGSERRPVRAAVAARRRGQGRLRAVTVTIGAASVLTGGGIALGLPGTVSAAAHSQTSTSTPGGSTSGGLKSSAAPTFVAGSSQVTSGGS